MENNEETQLSGQPLVSENQSVRKFINVENGKPKNISLLNDKYKNLSFRYLSLKMNLHAVFHQVLGKRMVEKKICTIFLLVQIE